MLQLKKFPDIPVSTLEEARGSRPHPEEPRFCLIARDEGSFPCLVGKEFWAFPSHLKRRHSPQERREEVKRRATIPRVPLMSQSIPEDLFSMCCLYFHAEDRLRPWWHVGQLFAKSSCESLEGKPRGKSSRESHRSHDRRDGKHHTAATAREESARVCPLERRADFPGRLQNYPNIHFSSGEEFSGSGPDSTPHLRPWHRRECNARRPPNKSYVDCQDSRC